MHFRHIVPRKIGFEFNLPPYILRHPANLQFISHAENIQKGFLDRRLTTEEKECIIESLLNRILTFEKSWREQDICIEYIKDKNENMDHFGSPFRAPKYHEVLPTVAGSF